MKKNKLEKTGIILVFTIVVVLLFVMGYQVGVECYRAVSR
jgi:hypothetical protein